MKIFYRFVLEKNKYPDLIDFLVKNKYPIERDIFNIFEMDDKNVLWIETKKYLKNEYPIIRREFDIKELQNSKYLKLGCLRRIGYPMPDDSFDYRKQIYDNSIYCEKCGEGKSQIGPFKVRENKFKKINGVFKLNWEEDRFFVKKEIYNLLFKKYTDCYEVLNYKNNQPIDDIVQLKIDNISEIKLEKKYKETCCQYCKRKKYLFPDISYIDKFESDFNSKYEIFKLQEYFGTDDHRAYETIVITNRLYKEINRFKIKGVFFEPINI